MTVVLPPTINVLDRVVVVVTGRSSFMLVEGVARYAMNRKRTK
jgi:hypothetical protein